MIIHVTDKGKIIKFDLKNEYTKFMNYLEYHGFGSNAQAGIPLVLNDVKEIKINDFTFCNPELK